MLTSTFATHDTAKKRNKYKFHKMNKINSSNISCIGKRRSVFQYLYIDGHCSCHK